METLDLKVDGMTCGGCVKSVTRVLTGIPGVADSNVLLRNSDRQARKREIVILLKPTIIQNDATWGQDLRETRERLERFIPRRPAQEASPR